MTPNLIQYLTADAGSKALYNIFKARAEELTVQVFRIPSLKEALHILLREKAELGIKKICSPSLNGISASETMQLFQSQGIDYSDQLDRVYIEQADLGISEFDLGIAESGTLVQDASSLHTRLVSMLPPIHVGILYTQTIVGTFQDAIGIIESVYGDNIPAHLSYITGPSKTADIERELTIGVHGPAKLMIFCIDKDKDKNKDDRKCR
jgi:L-lactate dehydrogenase complex protein LldG